MSRAAPPPPPLRRVVAALVAGLLLAGVALAQADVAEMERLIALGFYNSAAQLNGPRLVADHPDDPHARYLYAYALYLIGRSGEARGELETALDLAGPTPDATLVHLNGLLRADAGDGEGAMRALENAFLRTRAYDYAMDWARIAWQVGAYDRALDAYTEAAATERGQREPWPHLDRGRLLLFLDRSDEAIAAFDRAIEVFEATDPGGGRPSPAYVEAFYRLGEIYEARGDYEAAEANYRAALSSDSNYTPAVEALDRVTRRPAQ